MNFCPTIALAALHPTQISRPGCRAACRTARAISSGWKMGGTGWGWRGIRVRTTSNCGVFTAGNCSMQSFTLLLSCSNSQRNESVNARIAAFEAQ